MAGHQRGRKRLHEPGPVVTAERAGDPRVHGGFERPSDGFVLRDGLTARGAMPVSEAFAEVRADWARQAEQGTVKALTVTTHVQVATSLERFLNGRGVTTVDAIDADILLEWMYAVSAQTGEQPTVNVTVLRRAVARSVFATFALLGITDHDITRTLGRIRRPVRLVVALSSADVAKLKSYADANRHVGVEPTGATKPPVAVALALLGGQTPEIHAVRVKDIDLLGMAVWLHSDSDRYRDRWVPIDDSWCFDVLAARVAYLTRKHGAAANEMSVAYEARGKRDGSGPANPAASTCGVIDKVMRTAGLKTRRKIRVASINEYVAMRVWEATGRIEAVAARLGMSSLDAAAHIIGYDWRDEFALTMGERDQ